MHGHPRRESPPNCVTAVSRSQPTSRTWRSPGGSASERRSRN